MQSINCYTLHEIDKRPQTRESEEKTEMKTKKNIWIHIQVENRMNGEAERFSIQFHVMQWMQSDT